MPDSFTVNRNIIQCLVGSDSGTWGGLLNSGAFGQLDLVLGATQAISMTSADVTLSTAQWNNCAIALTGTLTGNHNLILPFITGSSTVAVGGLFVVQNNTTGAYNVTVITSVGASTGVVVPQGVRTFLYSDGTNVWYADDSKLQLIPWSGNPNGFVAGIQGSVSSLPSAVWDYTNDILYFCVTTGNAASAIWQSPQAAVLRGFDTAANLQIDATHTGGNLLNISLKAANTGSDPTAGNPIIVNFQGLSGSATDGSPATVNIVSALGINTNATGASLGSVNNTAFRIWLALFNNAGTAVLAMRNCSTATAIYSLAEYGVASTVSISGGATSAGVWYTPNGTTLTNCAFRIIGYLEYTSGLATAGTYTADPNNVVLFGPGIKKPGDNIQTVITSTTTPGTTSSGSFAALSNSPTASITPTSAVNLVRAFCVSTLGQNSTVTQFVQFQRGSTLIGNPTGNAVAAGGTPMPASLLVYDSPTSISSQTYSFQGKCTGGVLSFPSANTGCIIELQEIMG